MPKTWISHFGHYSSDPRSSSVVLTSQGKLYKNNQEQEIHENYLFYDYNTGQIYRVDVAKQEVAVARVPRVIADGEYLFRKQGSGYLVYKGGHLVYPKKVKEIKTKNDQPVATKKTKKVSKRKEVEDGVQIEVNDGQAEGGLVKANNGALKVAYQVDDEKTIRSQNSKSQINSTLTKSDRWTHIQATNDQHQMDIQYVDGSAITHTLDTRKASKGQSHQVHQVELPGIKTLKQMGEGMVSRTEWSPGSSASNQPIKMKLGDWGECHIQTKGNLIHELNTGSSIQSQYQFDATPTKVKWASIGGSNFQAEIQSPRPSQFVVKGFQKA